MLLAIIHYLFMNFDNAKDTTDEYSRVISNSLSYVEEL